MVDLDTARKRIARWRAAQINVKLIVAREPLAARQAEYAERIVGTKRAQSVYDRAVTYLNAATKALAEAPGVVRNKQVQLENASKAAPHAEAEHASATLNFTGRQKQLEQVRQAWELTRARSAKEPKNQTLEQASAKMKETLDLLSQDLANTAVEVKRYKKALDPDCPNRIRTLS